MNRSIRIALGLGWLSATLMSVSLGRAADSDAVSLANRPFTSPETTPPSLDESAFSSTDVGAKIPNYTPGARWGTQGDPFTLMQDPVPAEVSINAFAIPKDFRLSVWAKESDQYWPQGSQPKSAASGLQGKPIAMNWDHRGRMWVCETIDYPNELQSPGQGRDRIRICEDTDNDGQADKYTVFAESLSIPSTLMCYRGGAIVQDGQSTVYLKDVDGDDKADFRQVLITGWAMGDTHGGVSNLQYGPDNWIWGMQGYNNSTPVINGEPQMSFRQGFWRFKVNPGKSDTTAPAFAISKESGKASTEPSDAFNEHTIRVEALEFVRATNNNTWGLGFSEEGYVFGSTANGCPSVHMPIPNRYYDQVAGWSPKTLERISPTFQFQPIDKEIRQVDYHGGYTAGCGHAIYTARNYPDTWWNRIAMVCGPTGHLVGAFVLEKQGAGYRSYNAFNVVASIDDWTAPIMSEVGPDGNVWVLDWYNYIIQHNPTPNGFQTGKGAAYESDLRDKRFGRIYRLIYDKNGSASVGSRSMQLDGASSTDLVQALSSDNFFWRRTAQRLLVERGASDAQTLGSLVALLDNQETDEIGLTPSAMHAIWTLAGLADSGNEEAQRALANACEKGFKHPSSPVRNAAVASCTADQLKRTIELGLDKDDDPRVQLTVLLRVADDASRNAIDGAALSALIAGDSSIASDDILLDAWTAAAATSPIDTLVILLGADNDFAGNEMLGDRVSVLAEHVARSDVSAADVQALLAINPESPLAMPLWEGLARGWPRDLVIRLSDSAQQRFRERFLSEGASIENKAAVLAVADKWSIDNLDEIVSGIQNELLAAALHPDHESEKRLSAWDQAIRLSPGSERILEAIDSFFTPQLNPEVGVEAIGSLQQARVDGLAEHLLAIRGKLGPKMASAVLTLLLARADTTEVLLDAIAAGDVRFTDLQLDQRQAILGNPNQEIAARAAELMESQGAMVTSDRQGLVDQWMPVTEMKGNIQNGIAMFTKHCGACHKHGEMGKAIGPNLTGMAVHPKQEILVNILDPSRSVENNFRIYQILTVDGAVLSGMLAGESANAIRMIDAQGKEQQVLREDIEAMNASPKSLMPEGFESSISRQEMADLLAFLNNRGRYTPLSLSGAATLNGVQGLPGFRGAPGDKFVLDAYGTVEVQGVPFELEDPQDGRVPNIIALQGSFGRGPRRFPQSTSVSCSGSVSAIHLLGGIAFGGFPINRNESTSLIVRCVYDDGTSVDHELVNGKHIANYRDRVDVPESKYAIDANGYQIRYLKIPVDSGKQLKSIDFVKGEDFTFPLVFAITVESSDGDSH